MSNFLQSKVTTYVLIAAIAALATTAAAGSFSSAPNDQPNPVLLDQSPGVQTPVESEHEKLVANAALPTTAAAESSTPAPNDQPTQKQNRPLLTKKEQEGLAAAAGAASYTLAGKAMQVQADERNARNAVISKRAGIVNLDEVGIKSKDASPAISVENATLAFSKGERAIGAARSSDLMYRNVLRSSRAIRSGLVFGTASFAYSLYVEHEQAEAEEQLKSYNPDQIEREIEQLQLHKEQEDRAKQSAPSGPTELAAR